MPKPHVGFGRCNRGETNATEFAFRQKMEAAGWRVTKRGWPDFICINEHAELVVVEVKPRKRNGELDRLKKPQAECMDHLQAMGIACYVSDGEQLIPWDGAQ